MNETQDRIAVHLGVCDDADRREIVHLFERDGLAFHLLVDAVEMLGSPLDLAHKPRLRQCQLDQPDDFLDVPLPFLVPFRHPQLQAGEDVGLQILEA